MHEIFITILIINAISLIFGFYGLYEAYKHKDKVAFEAAFYYSVLSVFMGFIILPMICVMIVKKNIYERFN